MNPANEIANKTFELAKKFFSSVDQLLKLCSDFWSPVRDYSHDQLYRAEIVSLIHTFTITGYETIGVDFLNSLMASKYNLSEFNNMESFVETLRADYLNNSDDSFLSLVAFTNDKGFVEKEVLKDNPCTSNQIIDSYRAIGRAYLAALNLFALNPLLDAWIDRQKSIISSLLNNGRYDRQTDKGSTSILVKKVGDSSYSISFSYDDYDESSDAADSFSELDALIGLEPIKSDVKSLVSLVKMQQLRKTQGLTSVPVSLHLVFTGNPGTGKTTVARILAKIYKEIGVLKTGQLVEVDRSCLVAGYVGQTAIKTQERIKEAMGGILFIDEAYTLAKDGNDFGQEAIDTIIKAMEDHRDEFVVIVAGYDEPMQKFISSNPGLRSRFNKYFRFPDYSAKELLEIFKEMVEKYDYSINENALNHVAEKINITRIDAQEDFANARSIRNLFEHIITRQAIRVSRIESPTKEELLEIKMEDLD